MRESLIARGKPTQSVIRVSVRALQLFVLALLLKTQALAGTPVISGVSASATAPTSATISWSTDQPATSQVDYGTTSAYGSSTALNSSLVTSHSIALSSLAPSITYHYRVRSSDGPGNQATLADFTVITPAAAPGIPIANGKWTMVLTKGAPVAANAWEQLVYAPPIHRSMMLAIYHQNNSEPNETLLGYNFDANTWDVIDMGGNFHTENMPEGGESQGFFDYNPNNNTLLYHCCTTGSNQPENLNHDWWYDLAGQSGRDKQTSATPNFMMLQPGGAFDAAHNRFIAEGGASFMGTWIYDPSANAWQQTNPGGTPPDPSLILPSMAYNTSEQRVYLFGGYNGSTYFADLYKYDVPTNTWTQITPAGGVKPPGRYRAMFAYDSTNNIFLLYGGVGAGSDGSVDPSGAFGDTWIFDPTSVKWTQLQPPQSPGIGYEDFSRMSYDSEHNAFVLAHSGLGGYYGGTWTAYAQQTWLFRYAGSGPNPGNTSPSSLSAQGSINRNPAGWGKEPSVASDGSSVFVAWSEVGSPFDSSNAAWPHVYANQYIGGSWLSLGSFISASTLEAHQPSMAIIAGAPWASWYEAPNGSSPQIAAMNWNGSSWQGGYIGRVGSSSSTQSRSQPVDVGGTPHIAFLEVNDSTYPQAAFAYVKAWNGSAWNLVGSGPLNQASASAGTTAASIAIASNGTHPYVTWTEYTRTLGTPDTDTNPLVYVSTWNGSQWVGLGGSLNVSPAGWAYDSSIALLNGIPYVAWTERTQTGNAQLYVATWNGAQWTLVGSGSLNQGGSSGWAYHPTLAVDAPSNSLYVAWVEQLALGQKAQVFVAKLVSGNWSLLGSSLNQDSINGSAQRVSLAIAGGGKPVAAWGEVRLASFRQIYVKQWNGSSWVQLSATATSDSTAPNAPSGLTATTQSANEIDLSWTASTDNVGVAGYYVYRNGSLIGTVTSALIFQDTSLSPATSYTYTVAAFDVVGNTSPMSAAATATTASTISTGTGGGSVALVQKAHCDSSSSTTDVCTFPAAMTSGNTIIAVANNYNALPGAPSCGGGACATFIKCGNSTTATGSLYTGVTHYMSVFSAAVTSSGGNTVQLNGSYPGMVVGEFSGLSVSGGACAIGLTATADSGLATSHFSPATGTLASAGLLMIGVVGDFGSTSMTAANGFSLIDADTGANGGLSVAASYEVYNSTVSTYSQFNSTLSLQLPNNGIAAFSSAASPAADFSLTTSPASLSVMQGNSGSTTITTTALNGFNGSVSLSASGQPSGVTVSFSPNPIAAPGTGNSAASLAVASTTATGTYQITITASSGGITHTTTVSLTVSPSVGGDGQIGFVQETKCDTSSPTASCTLPANVTLNNALVAVVATYGSAPASPPACTNGRCGTFVQCGASADSGGLFATKHYLSVYSAAVTSSGATAVQINASYPGMVVAEFSGVALSNACSLGLQAQNDTGMTFTHISPTSGTLAQSGMLLIGTVAGQGTTALSAGNGLTLIDVDTGSSGGLSVGASFQVYGSTASTFSQFGTTSAIQLGDIGIAAFYPATSSVADFSLTTSPGSLSVVQGNSGTTTVTTTALNGFNGSVSLSASGQPSGVTVSFSPNPIAAPGTGNSTATLAVASTTATGTYTITITASGGGVTHTTAISLTVSAQAVADFSLTTSPGSLSVVQGNSGTTTVTTTALNGFNGSVSLSASGQPSGVTVSFSPNPIAAPGTGNSTATLAVASTTATGTYTITITASGGGVTHTTTVSLTVSSQIGFVQETTCDTGNSTASCRLPANVRLNNTLVAVVATYGSPPASPPVCTNGRCGTFVQCGSSVDSGSLFATKHYLSVYSAAVTSGGGTSVQVNASFPGMIVAEFSGVALSNACSLGLQAQNDTGMIFTHVSPTSGTLAQTGMLLIGTVADPGTGTLSAGNGFTLIDVDTGSSGGLSVGASLQVYGSTASTFSQFGTKRRAQLDNIGIAAFKPQ